jgi:hypothetical protein
MESRIRSRYDSSRGDIDDITISKNMSESESKIPASEDRSEALKPDEIDAINPQLVALAWENYLKRKSNAISESKAREMLFEELVGAKAIGSPRSKNLPLLDGDTEASVTELKRYLAGYLDASRSRFATDLSIDPKSIANALENEKIKSAIYAYNVAVNRWHELKSELKRPFTDRENQEITDLILSASKALEIARSNPEDPAIYADSFVKAAEAHRRANELLEKIINEPGVKQE